MPVWPERRVQPETPAEVFLVFLRLGLTSFGGPVAHIGYFHSEFVTRRRWLDDGTYGEYVAMAQFLPGPASSQVGLAVGAHRAGLAGSFAAWLGFTLPSALIMLLLGFGIARVGDLQDSAALHGLKLVAVAVVVLALWQMAQRLCPDRKRMALALCSALIVLALPPTAGQIMAMLAGAVIGLLALRSETSNGGAVSGSAPIKPPLQASYALAALVLFFLLLAALPLATWLSGDARLAFLDSFYRAGALVVGGGHVVLPLLEAGVVPPGWIDKDAFLAGYGAAQALPGPLFTFAVYLGALPNAPISGLDGAVLCILAIFLPSFLLVFGVLPFWARLRRHRSAGAALAGTNAAVVGVLLAALYDPLWVGGVTGAADFAFVIAALGLLSLGRVPPWLVVILGALSAPLLL